MSQLVLVVRGSDEFLARRYVDAHVARMTDGRRRDAHVNLITV